MSPTYARTPIPVEPPNPHADSSDTKRLSNVTPSFAVPGSHFEELRVPWSIASSWHEHPANYSEEQCRTSGQSLTKSERAKKLTPNVDPQRVCNGELRPTPEASFSAELLCCACSTEADKRGIPRHDNPADILAPWRTKSPTIRKSPNVTAKDSGVAPCRPATKLTQLTELTETETNTT